MTPTILTPPDPSHPALKVAPATLRAALERLLAWCENGKPAAIYKYRDGKGNCCAIGQFFTLEQLDEIASRRGLNTIDVLSLATKVGESNITVMTGMSLEQATAVQKVNDTLGKGQLAKQIRLVLDRGMGSIGGIGCAAFFDLKAP